MTFKKPSNNLKLMKYGADVHDNRYDLAVAVTRWQPVVTKNGYTLERFKFNSPSYMLNSPSLLTDIH